MDRFATTSMHAGVSPCFRRSSLRLASKASSSSRVISFRIAVGVSDARKWGKKTSGVSKLPFSKSQRWAAILELRGDFQEVSAMYLRVHIYILYIICHICVSLRHSPRHLQSCRILRRLRNSRASSSRSPHSKATLGAHWVPSKGVRYSIAFHWSIF